MLTDVAKIAMAHKATVIAAFHILRATGRFTIALSLAVPDGPSVVASTRAIKLLPLQTMLNADREAANSYE
jgi:hypothetical protein